MKKKPKLAATKEQVAKDHYQPANSKGQAKGSVVGYKCKLSEEQR